MTLLEQCQNWHENDEYQKIIDALEALPAAERTPETDSELARAYNNIAQPSDKELFRKALDLLKPHEEYFAEDHCWNFRIAYAYFYLDKEYLALPYFEKALAARPGDEDTQQFIDECRSILSLPKFSQTFRQRTQKAWEAFLAEEGELRRLLDYPERESLGDFLVSKCQSILQLAFDNIAFELGRSGEKYELILTPEGDSKQLFSLVYFQKYAPPQILQRWNITVGRQPSDNNALRSGGWEINGNEVQIWPAMRGDKRIALELYCAKLIPLLSENENRAWWLLSTLTDLIIGEIPAIAYIEFFNVLSAPKPEASLTLSELPQFLRDRDFDLNLTAQDFLDNNYIGYELEAVEDPDADWRLDTYIGSTRLPVLINEYLRGDCDAMNAFHDDGAVPGFLCYPLNDFTGDDRAKAILDFRDALEKAIVERAGSEAAVTFLGGATGLYCGYLDFIAWDLYAVLDAAKEFLQSANLPWANFHSFRRYTGAVRLLNGDEGTQTAPPIHEKTGSLLSPQDIETLQSFDDGVSGYFHQMLNYLENFIKEGAASGAFTEQQAKEDLQIANWYAFAANNIDAYKYYYKVIQWMPASEKNAHGCATWYYRYSAALMYCGQLKKALQYAERGAAEEPEYPWVWLQVAKLRNHFGDKAGALDAIQQGLKAVPGDYEFLTLGQEIEASDSLERMEYHWINPDADRKLQEGLDEDADAKQQAIACIRTDEEGLQRFQELFHPQPTDYTKNNPYCRFNYAVQGHKVDINFCMNEAGLSKMRADWLIKFKELLDGGQWLKYTAPDGNTGTLAAAFIEQNYHVSLAYRLLDSDEHFQIYLRPDYSLIEDAFWSSYNTQSENAQDNNESENPQAETEGAADNTGKFCGFVLLADAHFDRQQFISDMQEKWDITVDDNEDTSDVLLFSVGSLTATVSLMPTPIPGGEAESSAQNNYLWPEAVETAKAHQAHLLVAVFDKEKNLLECGKLYTKLLAACCRQPNATGVYTSGVVFQPRFYEGFADMLKENRLPIFNWIWFGLYRSENGLCGYTYGMDVFGKEEMEVLDADAEPNEVRDFLSSLAAYVLECGVTLQDGETFGFSAEDKHSITRSPGVALPQQATLKIGYAPLEAANENDSDSEEACGEFTMDDAAWHLESIEDKALPVAEITAYNHLAIYLRWCMERNLMSDEFLQKYSELIRQVQLAPADINLRQFIRDELNGTLMSSLFNEKGAAFAHYYYGFNDYPYYPSDIDNYALEYFGQERYYSDEFQDEAYLFIPFDESYYQAMAQLLNKRYANWQQQKISDDTAPSQLAQAMMDYLGCECHYFPSMADDDPIMSAYSYAKRRGVKEGFIPMLIRPDETLWECLIMNSDPDSDGAPDFKFNKEQVAKYTQTMLTKPVGDGKKILEALLDVRKEEAADDEQNWEEDVEGQMTGGYENNRLASYWHHRTAMTYPLILAKIPVKNPWEIFAYLPFGNWNECPDTPELMAVAKYWFEQYGAVPAAMTHDELEFILPSPVPKEKAMRAAAEQYAFCPDTVEQSAPGATIGCQADTLRQSKIWYFWWD